MKKITAGETVWIDCETKPGPFSGELLITIDTLDGPVTGFVSDEEIRIEGGMSRVRGIVREVLSNAIAVFVRGSFSTTNGLANVERERLAA